MGVGDYIRPSTNPLIKFGPFWISGRAPAGVRSYMGDGTFFIPQLLPRPNAAAMGANWLKRCGFVQGSAFFGLKICFAMIWGVSSPQKKKLRSEYGFPCK